MNQNKNEFLQYPLLIKCFINDVDKCIDILTWMNESNYQLDTEYNTKDFSRICSKLITKCNKNQLELNTHPEFACLSYQHPISIVHFHTLLGRYTKERCRRDAEYICTCLTDPFFEARADCEVEKWKIQNPQVIIQSKVDA